MVTCATGLGNGKFRCSVSSKNPGRKLALLSKRCLPGHHYSWDPFGTLFVIKVSGASLTFPSLLPLFDPIWKFPQLFLPLTLLLFGRGFGIFKKVGGHPLFSQKEVRPPFVGGRKSLVRPICFFTGPHSGTCLRIFRGEKKFFPSGGIMAQ